MNKSIEILVSKSGEAMILFDEKAHIVFWNEGAARMFGYNQDEVIGQDVTMLMPERYRADYSAKFLSFLNADNLVRANLGIMGQVMARRKSGEEFPTLASVVKSTDDGKITLGIILNDVSAQFDYQKRLEKALAEARIASEAKRIFFSQLNHEFRTPLNAILGFSEFLTNSPAILKDREKTLEYIGNINSAGERLLQLVSDMMSVSRYEGDINIRRDEVDVVKIISDSLKLVCQDIGENKVRIDLDLPETFLFWSDHVKLSQVITNILSNALKFCEEGGQVSIYLEPGANNHTARLYVKNTCKAIPGRVLEYLKHPLYRGENKGDVTKGQGLGLYVVETLTAALGLKFDIANSKMDRSVCCSLELVDLLESGSSKGNTDIKGNEDALPEKMDL